MGVNDYFDPKQTNILDETSNCGPGKSKFESDYYRQTYCSPGKSSSYQEEIQKLGQEVIYSSNGFNSIYIEFVGYEKHDKLIWK